MVMRVTAVPEREGNLFDLSNAHDRFLGEIRLPFFLELDSEPIVRNGLFYGISGDELRVENIVGAQI